MGYDGKKARWMKLKTEGPSEVWYMKNGICT